MLTRPSPLFSAFCLATLGCFATLTSACSTEAPANDDASETTAASGTAAETDTNEPSDTSDSASPSETDDGGNFISDEGPGTTEGGDGDLGAQCSDDSNCADGLVCNGVPGFGGVCSDCSSDADCPGGNCTFNGGYFACGDGSLGQMCESDAACGDELYCAEVVNLGGLVNGNFCSECKDDSQCTDGQLCAPIVQFTGLDDFSGQRSCIDPGTAPNNQLCDADGSGDEQCEGYCTTADIMGLIVIGVCGECETDAECDGGTCAPAMVGLDGFSGSTCG